MPFTSQVPALQQPDAAPVPGPALSWTCTHPVITFYLLAFVISWLGYVPVLLGSHGISLFRNDLWQFGLLLPACGPALAAWIATRRAGEQKPLLLTLRTALHWRVGPQWYLAALALPALLFLLAHELGRALRTPHSAALARLTGGDLASFALVSVLANPWEEIGWRGFALRRLQQKMQPALAALIVGLLWGVWHIPLFLWPANSMSALPFLPWFAAIVAESILLAWLYNRSGQSLAIAILFHIAFNLSGAVIGLSSETSLAIVNGAAAVLLLLYAGSTLGYAGDTLGRSPASGIRDR